MTKLEILTNKSVKILEMDILENKKYYENKNFESCPNIVSYSHTKDIDVTFLENMDKFKPIDDIENSILLYTSLKKLTPLEAQNPRMWLRLTHFEGIEYTSNRWSGKITEEYIKTHYFAGTDRTLHSRNALSRLWWAGHLCSTKEVTNTMKVEKALELLFKKQDNQQSLIERPNVVRDPKIFAACLRMIDRNNFSSKDEIQSFMKEADIISNSIVTNTLTELEIDNIFDKLNY